MIKKIFIYTICCMFGLIYLTGCENQTKEPKNTLVSLCNEIENDIESYQSNEITYDDLYSKVEEYNNECQEQLNDICIYIKSIITTPSNRKDIQMSFAKKILESCRIERNSQL